MQPLMEGDYVRKVRGYRWPGKIVSLFLTEEAAPQVRYVVRCIAPGAEGGLHIFAPDQIEAGDAEADVLLAVIQWLKARGLAVHDDEGRWIDGDN